MPDDQTTQNLFISHKQFVKSYHFNPIHVATKRELIGLLQQSIPFCVDLVYILPYFSESCTHGMYIINGVGAGI